MGCWRVFGINEVFVFFNEILFGIEGSVDAEHPVVEEEGLVPIRFEIGDGFVGHAIFDVFVGRGWVKIWKFPGSDKRACRSGSGPMWNVDIEALFEGREGLGSEVPFSEVRGGVSAFFNALPRVGTSVRSRVLELG